MQSATIGKLPNAGKPRPSDNEIAHQSTAPLQAMPAGGAIAEVVNLAPRSIFHQPWWLDIATDGNWRVAKVQRGNDIVGEMPYALNRRGFWRTSQMPPLTRTLGPVFKESAGDPTRWMLDRVSISEELIRQIPDVHSFYQIFDPRVDDALAFGLNGFTVSTRYTLQFASGRTVEGLWKALHYKTRNMIRTGQKFVNVAPLEPDEFNRFYDSNLEARSRSNVYGSHVMHRLVSEFTERGAGYLLGAHDLNGALVAAIGVTFDTYAAYYMLSSRTQNSHGGAISVLVWEAIQDAVSRGLTFDFDGIPNVNTFRFLSGFKPALKPRIVVERHSPMWSMAKASRRLLIPRKSEWFVSTA